MEANADSISSKAQARLLPPACYCISAGKNGAHKRTKFFFGARYLWTRDQMQQPAAKQAHGIRVDVPSPPGWMQVSTAHTAWLSHPVDRTGSVKRCYIESLADKSACYGCCHECVQHAVRESMLSKVTSIQQN